MNHGQNWKGWERSGEKGLIISDNQAQTCLIITINDTSTGDLPLIITISDTCKNQPKRLDFDNTINLSSLIVSLVHNTDIFYLPPLFKKVHTGLLNLYLSSYRFPKRQVSQQKPLVSLFYLFPDFSVPKQKIGKNL